MISKATVMLACVAVMLFTHGVAGAQEPFPQETLSASNLSDAQRGQIEAFMDEVVAGLKSGEAVQIMNARRAAQRELTRPQVRVPFRLDFAAIAAPMLVPLTKDPNDLAAINAVYVLGDIAAGRAAVALLEPLKDEREAVRYASVVAMEKSFTAANPVIPRNDVGLLRRQLAVQLAAEKSTKVVAAYVRTLNSAADPNRGTVTEMRDVSISLLGTTFADRVAEAAAQKQPVDVPMMDAMLAAGETVRSELTRVGVSMADAQKKDSARLGGHLLAYVRQRAQAGDINEFDEPGAVRTERQNLQTLAQLGEQIVIFSGTKLGVSIEPPALPSMIEQQQDDQFVKEVMGLIGPDGKLTASPFGFADDEFVKE